MPLPLFCSTKLATSFHLPPRKWSFKVTVVCFVIFSIHLAFLFWCWAPSEFLVQSFYLQSNWILENLWHIFLLNTFLFLSLNTEKLCWLVFVCLNKDISVIIQLGIYSNRGGYNVSGVSTRRYVRDREEGVVKGPPVDLTHPMYACAAVLAACKWVYNLQYWNLCILTAWILLIFNYKKTMFK